MLCSTAHFFQPYSGFMAPHQSRSLEGGFCSLSSNFFSALSLVQSSNGGQISKIGFLHLNDDGSCWTTTLQFLPPTTKRKSTIGDATLTHTHTPTCTPSQATEHIGLMYVLLLHFVAQMARFVRSPKLQIWSLPPGTSLTFWTGTGGSSTPGFKAEASTRFWASWTGAAWSSTPGFKAETSTMSLASWTGTGGSGSLGTFAAFLFRGPRFGPRAHPKIEHSNRTVATNKHFLSFDPRATC